MKEVCIFWFRRDLRLHDNAGLYHALKSGHPVVPVFIFDKNILDALHDKKDKRVCFIHDALQALQNELVATGGTLQVLYDKPLDAYKTLTESYTIKAVYTNHDYEPYAIQRDKEIADFLQTKGISFYTYKDQVIFEKDEVMKDNGEPYTVYTPYSKKWKAKLNDFYIKSYPTEKYFDAFYKQPQLPILTLSQIGFESISYELPSPVLNENIARTYEDTRNYPAVNGTTHLGTHLRFGTVSIRALARDVKAINETLLNELIWREFFQMILWHYPYVVSGSFRKEYDKIAWRNNEEEFKRWCDGQTGYPIVDAGMRELNATGFMHNRVRMIVASFLTKHLLLDWRWGEAYFAEKLLDYELAANNGNWQWAAGTGCDAAPYFRIFNPYLQTEKFDPKFEYINKWVPELNSFSYPQPIVQHELARKRCLEVYKKALSQSR